MAYSLLSLEFWRRWAPSLAALLLLTAGCERPEIEQYKVKRVSSSSDESGEPVRLLGAIFQPSGGNWFFKLMGPSEVVGPLENEFTRFIESVRFADKGMPPTWTVPEGWKSTKGDQFAMAAFLVGPEDNRLKLTVSQVGGDLLGNINRWRKQIGLADVAVGELGQECKQVEIAGVKTILVDFTGKKPRTGGMGPMAGGKQPPFANNERPPLKPRFTVPEGWKEAPLKPYSVATFVTTDGGESTVTTLSQVGGGVPMNIERWRDQVGLPPTTEDQLLKDVKPMEVDGNRGLFVDLVGANKRIYGAVVLRDGQPWYFKMIGDLKLMAKQREAFEAFVKSTRFEGAGHE